ncbi:MAG: endonuclease domain-containing protein, partial [Alphaproteobacteria bacterium]|nr:endonuclease domain-containing protein [Alphaproteobacteria bacterium]
MANQFARSLRNNATPAERKLWQQLRLLRAEGRHFRRQVSIGKYVADFACHYPKLVIELDGGQHSEAVAEDSARTKILNQHGFKVLRFWNSDIAEGLEGVVDRIRHEIKLPTAFSYTPLELHSTPTPNPSPQGGGEQ